MNGKSKGTTMRRRKKLLRTIALMVIVAFFFQSNISLYSKTGDELGHQFLKAKNEYINGQYIGSKNRLERLIGIINEEGLDRKDILGKCYLLLGAIYEKEGNERLAEENYRRAKDVYGIQAIDGVDLESLKIYRKVVKGTTKGQISKENKKEGGRKKKFPWLLVVGGVVVVAVAIILLKNGKKYELRVEKGEGVDGYPETRTYTHKKGTIVNYEYTTSQGYTELNVLLDGSPISPSGTITMNDNHTLIASTTKLVSLHIESNPSGAEVYVDDQSQGISTPCDLLIISGDHELRLVKNDYGEAKRTITFEENMNYNISANLAGYTYEFETKWGNYGSDNGQFNEPSGIALDKNNNVYIADYYNNRVQKFDSNGIFITKWGSEGTRGGKFRWPEGIALDKNNYVYVVDAGNRRIQKFDSNGIFITDWGGYGNSNSKFYWPCSIEIDKNNYVYVSDYEIYRIQKFDSNGIFTTSWGSHGNKNGQFDNPLGIAVDENNYVYVCDRLNNRIQKFDSNGTFITKWGSAGTGNGQFSHTLDIAVDKNNYLYVSSYHWIQKFDSNGVFISKWGRWGSGDGQFNGPRYIDVNENGMVFVSDRNNHRIQKFRMSDTTDGDGEWEIITTNASTSSKKTFLESFHKKFDKKRDRRDKNLRN